MASAASVASERPLGGVIEFYGALWSAARAAATRWRLDIVVEIVMVVAWFVIRTTTTVDDRAYVLWVIAAGALALAAPRSGLAVFVATSVFFEPDNLARTLGSRELVVLPLAVGVLARVAADRFRWRPGAAIWLALALAAGTALGVAHSFIRFDDEVALHAAQSWVGNMLAPVILLITAAWTARDGSLRVLAVATGVGVVAAIVCLIEYEAPGTISTGALEWTGFWKGFGARLAGTIPSPNALSAQLIVPLMILLAAAALARDLRLRAVAVIAALPMLAANYLTFSRAPLLGLYAFVVIVAWRFRRAAGIAVLSGGLVIGLALLPGYLQLRSGAAAAPLPGGILVATDEYRFRAWGAAAAMWADAPMTGQGFLAYKELAEAYGDPLLGSPHNEWLRLFAEDGVVVGLVGLGFLVATGATLARVPGWMGTGVLAGFAGYAIAATFNNPFLFVRVSAVAFAMIGVGLSLADRARSPAPEPMSGSEPMSEPRAEGALERTLH